MGGGERERFMSQGVCYYFVQTMMNTVTVVTNKLHCELGPNMLEKLTVKVQVGLVLTLASQITSFCVLVCIEIWQGHF